MVLQDTCYTKGTLSLMGPKPALLAGHSLHPRLSGQRDSHGPPPVLVSRRAANCPLFLLWPRSPAPAPCCPGSTGAERLLLCLQVEETRPLTL